VLFMTIPALALFYGGLVRTKNMLSILMQTTIVACVMMIVWVIYGYSSPSAARPPLLGRHWPSCSWPASPPAAWRPPSRRAMSSRNILFIVFQMTFAAITPALIIGAFAERVKFWPCCCSRCSG
jgi:Amt family ammonium transporter